MTGDEFLLYSDERNIVNMVEKKLNGYGNSNKQLIQKQNELFHLLCFLSLDGKLYLYNSIIPNEPGDFFITDDNKTIIVEVSECFGNDDSYAAMKNRINSLFKRKTKNKLDYRFSIEEVKRKLNKIKDDKNEKNYNLNNTIDEVILLIVTGEYTGCSATGNWLIKYLDECDIKDCKYKIWILDYFASGKDGNPIIIKNLPKEIAEFKKYFDQFN